MSRTTNPNEQQIIELIDMTSTRLHSLDKEGEHFKELWRFLNTIGRFRALTPDDQVLLFRLTLTASDGATRNGYRTYIRAVLQSLEVLNRFPGEHSGCGPSSRSRVSMRVSECGTRPRTSGTSGSQRSRGISKRQSTWG